MAGQPKVFISYRREATAAHAGRLFDTLAPRLGDENVFMDVEMPPGIDFVEHITNAVSGCHALLAVIGPTWAQVKNDTGELRLADPEDFVRLEVETALRRQDVTVIPVLVGGARMPAAADLPEGLRPLSRRHAIELGDDTWRYDVDRLLRRLEALLAPRPLEPERQPPPPPEERTPPPGGEDERADEQYAPPAAQTLIEGLLVAGVAAIGARAIGAAISASDSAEDWQKIVATVARRAESWGFVGAALAIWLALRVGRRNILGRGLAGLFLGAIGGAVGGAIFATPIHLTDVTPSTRDLLAIGALAASGAVLGALVGALWIPRRTGPGLLAGAAGAALAQLVLNGSSLDDVVSFGIQCVVTMAFVLATFLSLDALGSTAAGASPPRGPRGATLQ